MSEIVTVKPLPKKGRTQFTTYSNCGRTFGISMNSKTGEKVTGLTPEDEKELGEKLSSDLTKNSPFWLSFMIRLTNKEDVLRLDEPMDKLKYLVMKTKKWIAPSRDKINAFSDYVLYNEVEEAEKDNVASDNKLTAYGYLTSMSDEEKSDFLKLFGGVKTYGTRPSIIKKKLIDIVDTNPLLFISCFEDKDKKHKIMFEDLIQKKIVKVKNGAYYHNEDMLGADLNLAIAKLKNPKNQDLLIVLKKKLEETPFN